MSSSYRARIPILTRAHFSFLSNSPGRISLAKLAVEKSLCFSRNFPYCEAFITGMKLQPSRTQTFLLCTCFCCTSLVAQPQANVGQVGDSPQVSPPVNTDVSPVPLEWVPPALLDLQSQAAVKSSFTFDRAMLGVAADMMSDHDAGLKQSINKLDGLSVHTMRFGTNTFFDPAEVDAVRDAYHLRGWKHLVTTTDSGGPVHNETADVWLVMDGVNLRGAVVLAETPQSLTLVTVAGNLSPVDLLHLRGHFGIPRFDGRGLRKEN